MDPILVKFRSALRDFAFREYNLEQDSWHDYDRNIWLISHWIGVDIMVSLSLNGDTLIIRRIQFRLTRHGLGSKLIEFLTVFALENSISILKLECANGLSAQFAQKHGFVSDNRGNWVKRLLM